MRQQTVFEAAGNAPKQQRRLCMVAGYFPPAIGGIERYALHLSSHLVQRGWEVAVLTSAVAGAPDEESLHGIRVLRVPSVGLGGGRLPFPRLWSADARATIAKVRSWSPNLYLIHTHLFPVCLLGAVLARLDRRPALMIGHGSGHVTTGNPWVDAALHGYEHVMALAARSLVHRFYGVSKVSSEWWTHFGVEPLGTIYNGIDVGTVPPRDLAFRDEIGVPRDAELIAFAARLLPEKGVDTLVRTFLRIAGEFPRAHLAIAGDGPAMAETRSRVADHQRVRLLGAVDNATVLKLYGASDVFAYPSRYPEGLPTSLLEAGAMGCAAVVTPMGGTEEVVRTPEDGRIVRDEGSFERELRTLLSDPELRARLGENLKRQVHERFDWTAISGGLDRELQLMVGAAEERG